MVGLGLKKELAAAAKGSVPLPPRRGPPSPPPLDADRPRSTLGPVSDAPSPMIHPDATSPSSTPDSDGDPPSPSIYVGVLRSPSPLRDPHLDTDMDSPSPPRTRELHPVNNKANLLKLAEYKDAAKCRQELLVVDDMALMQSPKVLESLSHEPSEWPWVNPELLLNKERAFRFVEARLTDLLKTRNTAVKEISAIDKLIQKVVRGAACPSNQQPLRLEGPQLYCNPHQFGKVKWDEITFEAQRMAREADTHDGVVNADWYWVHEMVRKREADAISAFKEFNVEYLAVKRDSLQVFANKITEGIDELLIKYLRGPTSLGAANMSYYAHFKDKDVHLTLVRAVENDPEETALCYEGDGDDYAPLEGDVQKLYNTLNA